MSLFDFTISEGETLLDAMESTDDPDVLAEYLPEGLLAQLTTRGQLCNFLDAIYGLSSMGVITTSEGLITRHPHLDTIQGRGCGVSTLLNLAGHCDIKNADIDKAWNVVLTFYTS
jgi:hypothetical protein